MSYRCRIESIFDSSSVEVVVCVALLEGDIPFEMQTSYVDHPTGHIELEVQYRLILVRPLKGSPRRNEMFLTIRNPSVDVASLVGSVLINDEPYQPRVRE